MRASLINESSPQGTGNAKRGLTLKGGHPMSAAPYITLPLSQTPTKSTSEMEVQ